jgi:hypothetical protein
MASSDDDNELADILNSHKPECSQDSDLPAWIQAHVSTSAGAAKCLHQQGPGALQHGSPQCVSKIECFSLYMLPDIVLCCADPGQSTDRHQ